MKLIVGLGNPGAQYKDTRHNLGFLFLEYLKNNTSEHNFSEFKFESKFKGDISNGIIAGEKIILLKPNTFMNLSGEAIKLIINFYKINLEDIIIIYDDISMDFGKIKFKETGSAGGHNGIKSIINHLGKDFNRIKIGVGYNKKYEVSDWVLSKFKGEELKELNDDIFLKGYEILSDYIKITH